MAVNIEHASTDARPRWPAEPIDPTRVDVDYDVPADELTLFFGGRPVPSVCDPFEAPGFEDVAIMVGENEDDSSTREVVGIQVIPLLLGAVRDRPEWAALAWAVMAGDLGQETLRTELPGFIAEVAEAFERYWTPPPIEEQVVRLARADDGERTAGA